MYIATVKDPTGMTWVEAFSDLNPALSCMPPQWARLETPTVLTVVQTTLDATATVAVIG